VRTSDRLGRLLRTLPPRHPSPSPPHALLLPTSCLHPPQRRRSRSTPSSRASALSNRGGGARRRRGTHLYPRMLLAPCETPYLSTARARPLRSDVGRATALKRAVQRLQKGREQRGGCIERRGMPVVRLHHKTAVLCLLATWRAWEEGAAILLSLQSREQSVWAGGVITSGGVILLESD
jgi:hypothetical protein